VWRPDQVDYDGAAGADVLDLSCADAQRLFSTVKKKAADSREQTRIETSFIIRVHPRESAA
jgi:hypothetical protein